MVSIIKCPKCQIVNNIQKYCGNCGEMLLANGVELEQNIAPPPSDKRIKRPWLRGFLVFLTIYLLGGVLLDFMVAFSGSRIDTRFIGGISFLAGVIAFIGIVFNSSNEKDVSDDTD